jgi:hypothetical protein
MSERLSVRKEDLSGSEFRQPLRYGLRQCRPERGAVLQRLPPGCPGRRGRLRRNPVQLHEHRRGSLTIDGVLVTEMLEAYKYKATH